jgi:hypothetical protein
VELHLLGREAVDPALGLGQAAEDQRSPLAVGGGQVTPLDDREDIGETSVRRRLACRHHLDARGGQAGALHLRYLQPVAWQLQPRQLTFEGFSLEAGVEKGAKQHVAADSGEAVQVGDAAGRVLTLPKGLVLSLSEGHGPLSPLSPTRPAG